MIRFDSYFSSKREVEVQGFVEIETTAELLMLLNIRGDLDSAKVTKAHIIDQVYLMATFNDSTKIYYRYEIGQRAKKRFKLGNDNRQTSKPTR